MEPYHVGKLGAAQAQNNPTRNSQRAATHRTNLHDWLAVDIGGASQVDPSWPQQAEENLVCGRLKIAFLTDAEAKQARRLAIVSADAQQSGACEIIWHHVTRLEWVVHCLLQYAILFH